jgi:hypothetical protein
MIERLLAFVRNDCKKKMRREEEGLNPPPEIFQAGYCSVTCHARLMVQVRR